MTDTIVVTDAYTVDAGTKLRFVDQTGFELQASSGDVTLTVAGGVNVFTGVEGAQITGVEATGGGLATIEIPRHGAFKVSAPSDNGEAIGVDFANTPGKLTVGGSLHVSAENAVGVAGFQFDLDNTGTLQVSGMLSAVAVVAEGAATITNSGDIEVAASIGAAIGVVARAGSHIENLAQIAVTSSGGGAGGVELDNGGSLYNQGLISADGSTAVAVRLQGAGDLTNNGGVLAIGHVAHERSYGVYIAQDAAHPDGVVNIDNGGAITGKFAIFEAAGFHSGGVENVTNQGEINGDVRLGFGADTVINDGQIHGDVDLGSQDDVFQGAIGGVTGVLNGGGGDDLLIGGRSRDHILGDNPTGAGGDDTISGGAKGDTLSGGAGADTFVYESVHDSRGTKVDLITDLDNTDRIDLSAIDADRTQKGDQAFHLVAALDGHAGEIALSYDSATNLTTLVGDTNGDGHADLAITIAGDATAFTSFVL